MTLNDERLCLAIPIFLRNFFFLIRNSTSKMLEFIRLLIYSVGRNNLDKKVFCFISLEQKFEPLKRRARNRPDLRSFHLVEEWNNFNQD